MSLKVDLYCSYYSKHKRPQKLWEFCLEAANKMSFITNIGFDTNKAVEDTANHSFSSSSNLYRVQIFIGMTSHYTDIWNIATKCCWLRETGATCNIHCQMSLSNITCRVEENSHQPYPTSPNKQKLLVRHILKRQMMSLCYLGKFSVQNPRKRKGSEYKFWFIPSEHTR